MTYEEWIENGYYSETLTGISFRPLVLIISILYCLLAPLITILAYIKITLEGLFYCIKRALCDLYHGAEYDTVSSNDVSIQSGYDLYRYNIMNLLLCTSFIVIKDILWIFVPKSILVYRMTDAAFDVRISSISRLMESAADYIAVKEPMDVNYKFLESKSIRYHMILDFLDAFEFKGGEENE